MAEMPSPGRVQTLLSNLSHVTSRITSASAHRTTSPVRLILVSKLKPASDILALHTSETKPTHFGENYVQELTEKAELLPRSIKWHFIGGLQSNKAKNLAQIPNLWCVSSVDSVKKANALENGRKALLEQDGGEGAEKLRVMVQVNTSGEESKSGVEPKDAQELCKHIRDSCPHLQLSGLMTIGAIARSQETTPENENEDFETLRRVRDEVAEGLGVQKEELELSMGMSADYEGAIQQGSDEVRIGSTIFGERPPKSEAKVKGEVEEGKR
jgi:pyridoxal phosphate enzyme (YggS family)